MTDFETPMNINTSSPVNKQVWRYNQITKSHRVQGLDDREAEKLFSCPSLSNSLWLGWSYEQVHCPGGNGTDPIWRVLASSDGISSWIPLKPQHSNRNPSLLANQLWWIDVFTPTTPLIILDRLPDSLNLLCKSKTDDRFMQDAPKAVWSIPYDVVAFFPSLKHNFIAYRSSKMSECIFEIYQRWQSGFSRVYSNSCCSCSFKPETIEIGQSSHKMYSNNILSLQQF